MTGVTRGTRNRLVRVNGLGAYVRLRLTGIMAKRKAKDKKAKARKKKKVKLHARTRVRTIVQIVTGV